jgi:hypothetical protein
VTVSELHMFYPETGVTRFKLVLELKESANSTSRCKVVGSTKPQSTVLFLSFTRGP